MIVSPPFIICALYLLANFYALISGLINNKIEIELLDFHLKSSSLILAFTLQAVLIIGIWRCYKLFPVKVYSKIQLGSKFGVSLLFIQISYIVFNSYYGVNIAGSGASIEGGSLLSYAYILLQPDLLFLIGGLFLVSWRLFWINALIFLVSMILRGWMGGLFLLIIQLICKTYPLKLSKRVFIIFLTSFLSLILVLPFIIEAKWGIRAEGSLYLTVQNVLDFGYTNYLGLSLEYIAGRFQHVGHVALLIENSLELKSAYEAGKFLPYWIDGLPQNLVTKIMGIETHKLNTFMVEEYFGVINATWNTNPGMAGWIFVLREGFINFVIYMALIILIPFYMASHYGGARLLFFIFCFSIIYLFHGWIGAYFNLALWSVFIVFFSKIRLDRQKKVTSINN